jgi:hypothetical protein
MEQISRNYKKDAAARPSALPVSVFTMRKGAAQVPPPGETDHFFSLRLHDTDAVLPLLDAPQMAAPRRWRLPADGASLTPAPLPEGEGFLRRRLHLFRCLKPTLIPFE